ncbi:MAG: hypothetical protein KC680_01515 [Candidatus Peregrinibacteria bacterium]|nr:hypothetical protein [Candidatus Peregrinibacteria bacterium]MCB9807633.1 hypothetical protein [Candidatus Peribacteria bacterium]
MPQYAAVLGHQPHISIAELAAVVPGFTLESIEQTVVALFSADEELDDDCIDRLGGTVLLARRITEADVSMSDIPQLLVNECGKVRKKVTFSLRCYDVPSKLIKTAYIKGKEAFKSAGKPCRYVGNEKKHAAVALLHDSDVISGKKGVELFIVQTASQLWVGRTIGAQDIDRYTWRDMDKPVRDTTVGLLPPKLAQVMLNFGAWMVESERDNKKRKKHIVYTVLDPFCGTGVIPLECLLQGWHVLASDVSQKAVNGTKKNLDWVRKEMKILKKDVSDDVSKHDALKPFKLKSLPDMVVTETTLGPALTKKPTKTDVKKYLKDSEALEAAFLHNAAASLPGVPIVCMWPFWRLGGDVIRHEKIWSVAKELGYRAVLPAGAPVEDPEKLSLLYQRKDQFVGREIVLLLP